MEQQASNPNPNPGEPETMTDLQVEVGSPREEMEALRRDYEALTVDIRNFLLAVRHAEYPQKVMEQSRSRIRQQPVGAVLTAAAAGWVAGRLLGRKHK